MKRFHRWPTVAMTAVAAALLASCGDNSDLPCCDPPPPAQLLHVASPEWQDQIVYFVMTDRFNDGDPSNNDQGAGEFDPADGAKYSGGDLRGVEAKIDYIKGLGATAVWVTPPVANQWWDPLNNYGGYHGYWASNFMEVDKHMGTLADYKSLSSSLHKSGMYLIQDVVLNHTGNFFSYRGGYDAADPTKFLVMNTASKPGAAPTQSPFELNDPRNADHVKAGIYHWTPSISDFQDAAQEKNYQLSDLDDLNTENPAVRDALRKSYAYWIKEVGVDGFRIDTAFYVPPDTFKDFLYSTDTTNPGIVAAAKATGRENFLSFGEGFASDRAYEDTKAKKIDSYMTDPATGETILPGMINFPLYTSAGDVFARGRPTAELGYRIRDVMTTHKRPHLMPSFLDNHDVDRFLAGGSEAGLKQNLLMMMTLPGIPVIYYGTEQAFKEQRAAMFKAGYKSGGKDNFDTTAPLYQYIAQVSALRKANKVFSRGTPTVLKENGAAAGVFAYKMSWNGTTAFVVFNTADGETLLDNLETGLAAHAVLKPLFAASGTATQAVADKNGRLSMKLPARSAYVWLATADTASVVDPTATISMTALNDAKEAGDFTVSGVSTELTNFKLVIDGDVAHAQTVTPAGDGSWSATVDTATMIDPTIRHSIVAWSETSAVLSNSGSFFVDRPFVKLAEVVDPAGDDVGPTGVYKYPTNDSWGSNRQLDLRKVTVSGAGGAMRIDVQTNKVTTVWNPANGFDHVAFTIFIEVPGKAGGVTAMPLQNAVLPGGMKWHYRLRAHGWSNAIFTSSGASASNEGTNASPAAGLKVDTATNTVSFILPDASLGKLSSLSGVKVYVTTWDYDGGYRGLSPTTQEWAFWGGNGATDPLVMDDTTVISLP
ncbi:alpha-amylase family glycosyl hydrolase [Niveibacterium sp. COAC-50]|uniref:alpha-amylase family glycosyl hydrolase n=1 Tax=Niveibacterium sp. COAC-50 TaxID=2729384 RepID=UPI001557E374|nr:alpha-amylase family glycosyl hydrolase [Niveibacterium sp. COAC-50]